MKKYYVTLFLLGLGLWSTHAQSNKNIVISGTKFTYPLVETWIKAYQKANPEAKIQLLDKSQLANQKPSIRIASYDLEQTELSNNQTAIPVSKYALLPVTSAKNPVNTKFQKKGLKYEDLKKIFTVDPEESIEDNKPEFAYQVYTRSARVCSSITFANYLGGQVDDIVGKGISGDDVHLLEALKRDSIGITYNNLGYLYDLQARTPLKEFSIIPIDLNENGKIDKDEQIYQNLDQLLATLSQTKGKKIPVEQVYFIVDGDSNPEEQKFIKWIQSEGQKFNQSLGFLSLGEEATQIKSASSRTSEGRNR
ncbi:substrate-binding domain-containing protein [Flectobacillus rivi]|uniref:Substrate-binding domain-containing protein n=1 Tax=Flectobacillus rivi TaxID=2984209 RepID=A0ABT6Z940_9BACT|nr:substrate-binding domain-containing protein [Flectobacillus rivi]MDI9877643.1 substrate-binding domain-containing protein [Flectobacillus rivi]